MKALLKIAQAAKPQKPRDRNKDGMPELPQVPTLQNMSTGKPPSPMPNAHKKTELGQAKRPKAKKPKLPPPVTKIKN